MSIKDKLISNSMYLALSWAFDTLSYMAFWILLAKFLLPSSYGIVALSLQIVVFLSTLSVFGLDITTNKLVPELMKKEEKEKLQGLISSSLKIALAASVAFSLGFAVFSLTFPHVLNSPADALWIIVASTIAMTVASLLESIYMGFQNMKKVFLTRTGGNFLMVMFVVVFAGLNYGYVGSVLAYLIGFAFMILTRLGKKLFTIAKKSVTDMKLLLSYSIPAFTVTLFSVVYSSTQFMILSAITTAEITGLFAVPMKIAAVLSVVPNVLARGLFPIVSELSIDKNSKHKQSYLVSLVFRYGALLIVPMSVSMIVFSKQLILFFSTSEYLPTIGILPILVLGAALLGLANQFLISLYATGEPKKYRNSYIISTIVYIALSVTLTYYFSATGMAYAYLLSSLTLLLTTFTFIRKGLDLKLPFKDVGKMVVAMLLPAVFMFFTLPYAPNILFAAPFVLAAGLIYLVTLLKMNFYVKEDLKLLDTVAAKMPVEMLRKTVLAFRGLVSKFVCDDYAKHCE